MCAHNCKRCLRPLQRAGALQKDIRVLGSDENFISDLNTKKPGLLNKSGLLKLNLVIRLCSDLEARETADYHIFAKLRDLSCEELLNCLVRILNVRLLKECYC